MKTLQDIIREAVDKPRSEDEQRFIDKHVVDKKDHPEAEESQFTSKSKKAKRKADREEGNDAAVYEEHLLGFSSFISLEESVKPGKMTLKDGSSVMISKEDASAIKSVMGSMSGSSKKKMHEKMMKDKKGFEEIVKFAKEAA